MRYSPYLTEDVRFGYWAITSHFVAKVKSNQVFQFLGVTNGFYAVVNLFLLTFACRILLKYILHRASNKTVFCVDDLYHAFQLRGKENGAGCAMRRRKISTSVATLWAMFAGVFGILASAWILFHRYHQHKSYCTPTTHL